MAVGCSTGIFIGRRGESKDLHVPFQKGMDCSPLLSDYRKILSFEDVKGIIALQDVNKFIIHQDGYLLSYSLEVLARVAQYQAPPSSLDASLETIAGQNGNVLCCHAGQMGDRTISKMPFLPRRLNLKHVISSSLCCQELLTSHCACSRAYSPF
jgi:RHO1 GDP-GTP exchange protein 1/2